MYLLQIFDLRANKTVVTGIYDSLEQVYLYLDQNYRDELDDVSAHDSFDRSHFIKFYNQGGVDFEDGSFLRITQMSLNQADKININTLEEIKEKIEYRPLAHSHLEIDENTQKCIYQALGLDNIRVKCGKEVASKGYCRYHRYYLEQYLKTKVEIIQPTTNNNLPTTIDITQYIANNIRPITTNITQNTTPKGKEVVIEVQVDVREHKDFVGYYIENEKGLILKSDDSGDLITTCAKLIDGKVLDLSEDDKFHATKCGIKIRHDPIISAKLSK